jgi:hypothetical protein
MKHGRVWAALAAIAVLGGGSVGFLLWRQHQDELRRRQELAASVAAALAGNDRDELRSLLRRVAASRDESDSGELALAQGRLLLALGQERKAWDAVEVAATTPGASPEARLVGARILSRIHARTGERRFGDQARGLAEQHARATGDPASLFLSWQLAFRTADVEAFAGLRQELVTAHGDTLEGRTAKAIGGALAGLLATQFGLPPESDALVSAAAGDDARARLARLTVELQGAAPIATEPLVALIERWDEAPEELEIVLANGIIQGLGEVAGEPTSRQREGLLDATRRLERVLETWPTSIDARHAAVIALFGTGEVTGATAQGHLRWLLDNAPLEDRRRALWEALLRS